MILFAISIFLSAFLLFQIQPLIGKFILPWFGGTPDVWTTVMLFFQILLTGGYAYAYWLIGRVKNSLQSKIHSALTAVSILLLILLGFFWKSPITPSVHLPTALSIPSFEIFKLLTVSVGLPYFILAANGPLIQAWFARIFPQRSYARLYSLSNLGSLLGLLAYPFLIEPNSTLKSQGWIWSIGFIFFGCLAIWIALQNQNAAPPTPPKPDSVSTNIPPARSTFLLWIILSGTASLLLLATTNQISQEVAVIPFLWILPLTLYLLSFILAFSDGYQRKLYLILFAVSVALYLFMLFNLNAIHVYFQILIYCALMFSACMICHGELYLLRPEAKFLTSFYLMVSIGGACGGIFASLIAPIIFNGYWEFMVAFALAAALWLSIRKNPTQIDAPALSRFMLTIFILITTILSLMDNASPFLFADRNFYGVIRVREQIPNGADEPAYVMSHGITVHGIQFINPALRDTPTTYYTPQSGAGLALLNHPKKEQGLKVGLLGVGIGTLAIYGQAKDDYRLYEINPAVIKLAEGEGNFFSFVKDSQANIAMVAGDARSSLERELAENGSQNFDVLVLDTFSSDSIPVHLVTQEAFGLYLSHLAPDGIIAAHISNRHLDLRPIFWRLAEYYNLQMVSVSYAGDAHGEYLTEWLLVTRDPALLQIPAIQERSTLFENYTTSIPLWTDDYSNLFQILR
ncbi:MAG: fused MFS/spermidine synthase [Anaerolineales bacterium]|nr:fused MFS/spermidine synthase [Anaerolineales bacterium]